MYAIVRCGGRQEKVALDDVVTVDKLDGKAGSSITLTALLVVDGDRVISDPAEVGRYQVTADIVGDAAGPKINMIQYKNKSGYRRRLGHRQRYTQVRITGIGTEAEASTAKASTAKASTAKASTAKASTAKASTAKASTAKASTAEASTAKASSAEASTAKAQSAEPQSKTPAKAEED